MPTFDPSGIPEARLRAAVHASAKIMLQDADVDKDTLRDIRHRVQDDLGWGAFHSREKKILKQAVLDILPGMHPSTPPRRGA